MAHPLQHNKAISLIIKLRDEAVDNCITASAEVDPMGDAEAAMIPQGQRQRLFRTAGVPEGGSERVREQKDRRGRSVLGQVRTDPGPTLSPSVQPGQQPD